MLTGSTVHSSECPFLIYRMVAPILIFLDLKRFLPVKGVFSSSTLAWASILALLNNEADLGATPYALESIISSGKIE